MKEYDKFTFDAEDLAPGIKDIISLHYRLISYDENIIITSVITYFQLSLMRNWLLPVRPILNTTFLQFLAALIWAFLADAIYRRVFPPSETLIISEGDLQSLWEKFGSRKDRFNILKTMNLSSGIEQVKKECLRWYGSIVVGEMNPALRNELVDFCYRHYIRVYILSGYSEYYSSGIGSNESV